MTPSLIYNALHKVWEIHYIAASGETHWAKSEFKTLQEANKKYQQLIKYEANEKRICSNVHNVAVDNAGSLDNNKSGIKSY